MRRCVICGKSIENGTECPICDVLVREYMKENSGSRVLGGSSEISEATRELEEKNLELLRLRYWLKTLQDNKIPTKWFNPTNKGMKFNYINAVAEELIRLSFENLKNNIQAYNLKFDSNLTIEKQN